MPLEHWYFSVYKLFNDPPGTPPQKKCVNCKLALGSISLLSTIPAIALATRYAKRNVYVGAATGGVATMLLLTSVSSFKLAYDNSQYNQALSSDYKEKLREERRRQGAIAIGLEKSSSVV